jgi:cysteine desulfurase
MQEEAAIERPRLAKLRDRLWAGLQEAVRGVHLNGSKEHRIEGNLNVRIDQVDADSLLLAMRDVAISTGSACSSGALAPSPVLLALGLSPEQASQSVRLGLGRMTSEAEIDAAVERLAQVVAQLRD